MFLSRRHSADSLASAAPETARDGAALLSLCEQPDFAELLTSGDVAVAVSGGPDSMALLRLLSLAAARRGGDLRLHALTVDHGLRAEARAECDFIAAQIADWPHVTHHVLTRNDVPAGRVMERARVDRYALMTDWCRSHGVRVLTTAHHRDDQVETFLFRLAKGSGLDGLAGMAARSMMAADVQLVRPLLDVAKADLIAFCTYQNIAYLNDPTNKSLKYARNRIRHAIEEEGFTAKRLAVTAKRMMRAREALSYYAQCAYEDALQPSADGVIAFDLAVLQAHPIETRRRVLSMAVEKLCPERAYPPRMERFEDICTAIFDDPDFRRAPIAGVMFTRYGSRNLLTVTRG